MFCNREANLVVIAVVTKHMTAFAVSFATGTNSGGVSLLTASKTKVWRTELFFEPRGRFRQTCGRCAFSDRRQKYKPVLTWSRWQMRFSKPYSQTGNQLIKQSSRQPVSQSVNEVSQSVRHLDLEPVGQLASQSLTQYVSWTVRHLVSQHESEGIEFCFAYGGW